MLTDSQMQERRVENEVVAGIPSSPRPEQTPVTIFGCVER